MKKSLKNKLDAAIGVVMVNAAFIMLVYSLFHPQP